MTTTDPETFVRAIGMRALERADGRARWALTIEPRHLNRGRVTHGGVIATMADTAIGAAVGTVRREGETWQIAVDLTVVFLEATHEGDELVAEGTVVRRGGRMAYGEAVVMRGEELVARAHSSYVIFTAR